MRPLKQTMPGLPEQLAVVIPWWEDVQIGVRQSLKGRAPLPCVKLAIVFVDFDRFDSISISAAEQAIVLSEAGLDVDLVCNNQSGIVADFIVSRESFRPESYDLLLYHYYVGDGLLDDVLASSTKKIVFYQGITTPPESYGPYSPDFVAICEKGLLRLGDLYKFDFLMSGSEYNIAQIKSHTPASRSLFNYHVVPPAISMGRFGAIAKNNSSRTINIVSVGRIFSSKNIEGVLAFSACVQSISGLPVRLTIAGSKCEPSYVAALLSTQAATDLYEFDICLRPSNGRLVDLYGGSDVFASFSHHEGFCIPLVEAMAAGLITVAHSHTAMTETMGDAGIVVQPYDYRTAAERLVQVLQDEDRRRTLLSGQEKHIAENYREHIVAGKLIDAFSDFLRMSRA